MRRVLSTGIAGFTLISAVLVVACSTDDALVDVTGNGNGSDGVSSSVPDTGKDRELEVDVDDPPAGQGASNTYRYNEGVVTADAAFVAAVTVAETTLTVPTAGQEALLAKLRPNVVFSGDRRADLGDQNPLGFLRRVVAVRADGANSIIDTTPASLDDLFAEADFGGGGEPSSAGVQGLTGDVQLLDTGNASGSFGLNVNLGELALSGGNNKLKVSGAFSLSVQPSIHFKYEKRFLRVPNVEIDLQVAVRRLFGACLKAEFEGGGVSVTEPPKSKSFSLGTLRLPIPVPPPLVVTAKFTSEASCKFTPAGAFGYATQVENNSRMRVRFGIQDGETFRGASWPNVANTTRFEVLMQGGIKAECTASIKPGIYFYDRVGGFAELAPAVTAEAAGYGKYTQGKGVEGQLCAGAEMKVQVNAGMEADVWIAKYERKWNLIDKRYPIPGLPSPACVGTRRAADGCDGRPDGTYCSATTNGLAYKCRGGVSNGNVTCPAGKFCKTRGTESIGEQAQTSGGELACEDEKPATAPLDLSFCPNANAR